MASPISPGDLAATPSLIVLDIRPHEERTSALGFIPGSIGLHPGQLPDELIASLPPALPVVLACTSGRRSAVLAEQLSPHRPGILYNLTGGVLAWTAAGLPTCGQRSADELDPPRLESLDRLPRTLLSCFAAETVENALNGNEQAARVDPSVTIAEAMREPGVTLAAPATLCRVIDRVALVARQSGFPLGRIALNVDRLHAALHRLA